MCLSICYDGVMVEYVGVRGQVSVSNHAFYLVAAVFFIVSAAMCTPGYLACKHQGGFLSPSSFLLVGIMGLHIPPPHPSLYMDSEN